LIFNQKYKNYTEKWFYKIDLSYLSVKAWIQS